jgi:hypothetical protein
MKKTILVCVTLALAVAVLLGAAPAFATTGTTTGAQTATAAGNSVRLEKALKREQSLLVKQQQRFANAQQAIAKTETLIAALKAKGKDTAALEVALSEYKTALSGAQKYLDTAKALLAAHAGFDSSGKVTDITQARTTVKDAGKAQQQFHRAITKAVRGLRADVRAVRRGK